MADTDDARAGLVDGEWWELPDGSIRGPDGTAYRRTPERVKRRNGRRQLLGP